MNVICYVRFGQKFQIEEKTKRVVKYCEENGYNVKSVVIEQHPSRAPYSSILKSLINQNEIDGIVVDDIQSFTRNHKVLLEIFADMKKRNIKPISLNTSCEGLYEAYKSNQIILAGLINC